MSLRPLHWRRFPEPVLEPPETAGAVEARRRASPDPCYYNAQEIVAEALEGYLNRPKKRRKKE
jgi:hypothetical protein